MVEIEHTFPDTLEDKYLCLPFDEKQQAKFLDSTYEELIQFNDNEFKKVFGLNAPPVVDHWPISFKNAYDRQQKYEKTIPSSEQEENANKLKNDNWYAEFLFWVQQLCLTRGLGANEGETIIDLPYNTSWLIYQFFWLHACQQQADIAYAKFGEELVLDPKKDSSKYVRGWIRLRQRTTFDPTPDLGNPLAYYPRKEVNTLRKFIDAWKLENMYFAHTGPVVWITPPVEGETPTVKNWEDYDWGNDKPKFKTNYATDEKYIVNPKFDFLRYRETYKEASQFHTIPLIHQFCSEDSNTDPLDYPWLDCDFKTYEEYYDSETGISAEERNLEARRTNTLWCQRRWKQNCFAPLVRPQYDPTRQFLLPLDTPELKKNILGQWIAYSHEVRDGDFKEWYLVNKLGLPADYLETEYDKYKKDKSKDAEQKYRKARDYKQIRERRNKVLNLTDWTTGNDSPMDEETKQKFIEYRQKMRQITAKDNIQFNREYRRYEVKEWPLFPDTGGKYAFDNMTLGFLGKNVRDPNE